MTIVIVPPAHQAAGKLADVELHFTDGPLEGLKLVGFAIWERRTGGGRNVSFPSRPYRANGARNTFALLRTIGTGSAPRVKLSDLILDVFQEYEKQVSVS